MNTLNTKLLIVAVVACLSLPTMAFADENSPQNTAVPMGAGPMGGGPMRGGPMGGGMMNRKAELQSLHDQLKLTTDQESAWKTYISSMAPAHAAAGRSSIDWNKLTTPQRADKMLEMSKMHVQNMEAHVKALKAFYAALTPDQQKIFDDYHAGHRAMRQQHMPYKGMPPGMGMKDMPMHR